MINFKSDVEILFNFLSKSKFMGEIINVENNCNRICRGRKKLDEEFKQNIVKFVNEKLPQIYELLNKYKEKRKIIIFKSREEADNYIIQLKSKSKRII